MAVVKRALTEKQKISLLEQARHKFNQKVEQIRQQYTREIDAILRDIEQRKIKSISKKINNSL